MGALVFYQICVLKRFSSKSVSSLFLLLYHLFTILFSYEHFNFYLIKSSLELLKFVSSLGKSPSTGSYILLYYFTFVAFFHIDIFNSSSIFFMLLYSLKTLILLFLSVEKTFLITFKSLFFCYFIEMLPLLYIKLNSFIQMSPLLYLLPCYLIHFFFFCFWILPHSFDYYGVRVCLFLAILLLFQMNYHV